ncbi:MAG: ATP-binding protein [Bacteroidales bacterium]
MILEQTIREVCVRQRENAKSVDNMLDRWIGNEFRSSSSHALVITGVRRCGKSTLLAEIISRLIDSDYFSLNFDTPLLFDFSVNDFSRLDAVIESFATKKLFFDEIQLVKGWEMYVRQKFDEGFEVTVTGSNASLLSSELATRLTGRHISFELYPFSYDEFLSFKHSARGKESLEQYLKKGGFPEYLKTDDEAQLTTLYQDIIIRDIVARYGIKEALGLQRLAMFLINNVGNRFTAGKLKQSLSVGSTSTIINWCGFIENTYLFTFVDKFSYSARAQLINPQKIYAVDTGLVNALTIKKGADKGHLLENAVFLQLRRKGNEIYYFDDKGECDFVVCKGGKALEVIQVCLDVNPDNIEREVGGLTAAMNFFSVSQGRVITLNQSESINEQGRKIIVEPFWKWANK